MRMFLRILGVASLILGVAIYFLLATRSGLDRTQINASEQRVRQMGVNVDGIREAQRRAALTSGSAAKKRH